MESPHQAPTPAPSGEVRVNRTAPTAVAPPVLPRFSPVPKTSEIFRARVFDEPLVPSGELPSAAENTQLAGAVMQYLRTGNVEDVSPFEAFLAAHPTSPWRGALLLDLGIVYRRT